MRVCTVCGNDETTVQFKIKGSLKCGKCVTSQATKRKLQLRSEGLCVCLNPLVPGKTMCQEHLDRQAQYVSKNYQKDDTAQKRQRARILDLRFQGLCHCKQPLAEGRLMCSKHLSEAVARADRNQSANMERGMCRCGKPKDTDKYMCRQCLNVMHKNVKAKKRQYKKDAVAHLGGKCTDCGFQTEYHQVYDFHHLDPREKDDNLAALFASQTWDKIVEELDKCVLLCANCHRLRHARQATMFREVMLA